MKTNTHFFIISRSILRMRDVSDKGCRETQNTQFMFKHFLSKIVPFMRLCEKNMVQLHRSHNDNVMLRKKTRFACWDKQCKDTHTLTHSLTHTQTHTHYHKMA